MTDHSCTEVVRSTDYVFQARCECGHVSEGPNPDTARKRWEIHRSIQDAREALRGGEENEGA